MKQEEEVYIEEDSYRGRGEEEGIWIEGREREERRMKEERKGKEKKGEEETIEIKLNVQGLTEDRRKEMLEETGDDSIMCLKENTKKVDDIKIVKDVKIIQTMREMQDRKGGGLLIMCKEKNMTFRR